MRGFFTAGEVGRGREGVSLVRVAQGVCRGVANGGWGLGSAGGLGADFWWWIIQRRLTQKSVDKGVLHPYILQRLP